MKRITKETPIELKDVVAEVNDSLEKAQASLEKLTLEKASVNLKTTHSNTQGAGLIFFVSFSARKTSQTFNSVTVNFGTPKKGERVLEKDKNPLVKAIEGAAMQYKAMRDTIAGLKKENFIIEISFSIERAGKFGFEFKIFGIGINAGWEGSKTVFHSISLTFVDKP